MTMTALTESRDLFPPDFASVNSIGNSTVYQQATSTAVDMPRDWFVALLGGSAATKLPVFIDANAENTVFSIDSDLGKSEYWNIQKDRCTLRYFDVIDAFVREYARIKFREDALAELAELDDYAKEEEFEPPSPIAKKLAQELLEKLTRKLPREYAVSLWKNGDLVIYAFGFGWRVDIFCRANGGASLYLTSPLERGYQSHYQSAQDMSINTIIDALNKIPT